MSTMTPPSVLLRSLLAGAALLLLAACGDGDGITTTDPSTTASTTTSDATSTSSTASPTSSTTTSEATSTTTTTTGTVTTTTTDGGELSVLVYFATGDGSDCAEVSSFERLLAADVDPIAGTLDLLVAGPNPTEAELGAHSFFSDATAGTIRSTELRSGLLIVDVSDWRTLIPNASSSCGSTSLLSQLNSTVFQFPDVDRVRYLLDGSCDEFMNWLQRECVDHGRGGDEIPVSTNERATGSGCTPGPGALPDGRWFGYVVATGEGDLEFDLACWFWGTAAVDAAREDGEESPPPNDYHIRNLSDATRTVIVTDGLRVRWLPDTGDPTTETTIDYGEWATARIDRLWQPGVWLTVDDGVVVAMEEQYQP